MLVTPHGSHLTNFVQCDPDKTAMVEVVPAVVDAVFERNAREMNFRSYITSTGHRAIYDVCDEYVNERCDLEEEIGLKKCADGTWDGARSALQCDHVTIHEQTWTATSRVQRAPLLSFIILVRSLHH